jgi:hypothetical protein
MDYLTKDALAMANTLKGLLRRILEAESDEEGLEYAAEYVYLNQRMYGMLKAFLESDKKADQEAALAHLESDILKLTAKYNPYGSGGGATA